MPKSKNRFLGKACIILLVVLAPFFLPSIANASLKKIDDYTVAYSFYWCSDSPRYRITFACSKFGYPDWGFYCADYCECPPNRKCYVVHRCYNECMLDLPKIPAQGGLWGRCLAKYAPKPSVTPLPTPSPIYR